MTEVVVRKLKFDGSVRYEWDGELVDDRPGWLVVLHAEGHEKRETEPKPAPGDPVLALHYMGFDGPLSVLFTFAAAGRQLLDAKCDAALPATRHGNTIDFVDLDLDVVVLRGGMHYIRDQAVFAERSVSMAYPEDVKRQAHLGILHALRMVRRQQFPFDGHAERLLTTLS